MTKPYRDAESYPTRLRPLSDADKRSGPGVTSFADADLLAAVGGLPFEQEIAASGLTPAQAMSFTYRVELPGELVSAETGLGVPELWRGVDEALAAARAAVCLPWPASARAFSRRASSTLGCSPHPPVSV